MKLEKKHIVAILLIGLVLIGGVGLMAIISRTSRTSPIAPTAPQSQPSAGSCSLEFIIPTPSPTPVPACNEVCSNTSSCPSGLTCSAGVCRNLSCTQETDCVCPNELACVGKSIYTDDARNKPGAYFLGDNRISDSGTVAPGQIIVFYAASKINIAAAGQAVVWEDALSPDFEFMDGDACVMYNESTGVLSCTRIVGVEGGYGFAYRVKVRSTASGTISNTAVLKGKNSDSSCSKTVAILSETPTPTPIPACNTACLTEGDCPSSMTCSGGFCRNSSCTDRSDCICSTTPPTATPSSVCNSICAHSGDCPADLTCSNGRCRRPSCTEIDSCNCPSQPTATPVLACNSICAHNGDCPSNMTCNGGVCRNPSCTENSSCTCASQTSNPVSLSEEAPQELPKAGITLPTVGLVGIGTITIIIGILGLFIL